MSPSPWADWFKPGASPVRLLARPKDMEFILRYTGPLPGKPGKSLKDKQAVRMALHPQLEELCKRDDFFKDALTTDLLTGKIKDRVLDFEHDEESPNNNKLFCRVPIAGYEFVPLVHYQNFTACELDILWLRTERAGEIIRSGDLDNRLKTLFDGLRMPHKPSELPNEQGGEEPKRVYCLLDDDGLITKLTVRTHQMLEADKAGAKGTNVDLLIRVNVIVTKRVWGNISVV